MTLHGDDAARLVGVFRLQLFKPSETFITTQLNAHARWRPLPIGWRRLGPGPPGLEAAVARRGPAGALGTGLLCDPAPFLRALGARRPAVLHAHFAADGVYALPLARRLRAPLVTTLHGFDVGVRDRALLASGRAPLVQLALRRRRLQREGRLFLAVSHAIRRDALARGYPPERTHVLHLGVDLLRIGPPDGRPPEAGLVAHVGRLVEKKGAAVLLDAFARLGACRPHARLEIVGEGPLRAPLERRARRLGVADRVRFHGALAPDATLAVLRRAAVTTVPSVTAANGDREGLPTVALEAAALGRPVAGSCTAGLPEAVEDGVTGFLTPEGDAQALAARLGLLLDRPELAAEMGSAARRRVELHHDSARQTARLEDWYDHLAEPLDLGRRRR